MAVAATDERTGSELTIAVLFPTATEVGAFHDDSVLTRVCGVGLTAVAYATSEVIVRHDPDVMILAGVAGAYPASGLRIGDTVLVRSEVEADLGVHRAASFTHITEWDVPMEFDRRGVIECPYLPPDAPFPVVRAASLNSAMAPFIDTSDIEIESMEGAAFFFVGQQEGRRFMEIRTVSNLVGPEENWDLTESVQALSDGLRVLIDLLRRRG